MSTNNYDVAVVLLTDNCVDVIDSSIQSALNQTFPRDRIQIVAVDNHSTDGTYERLVSYVPRTAMSVYQVSEKVYYTRLINVALSFMDHCDYKYFTILSPGDILYPDFINKCTTVMDRYAEKGHKILICETDLIDREGSFVRQTPVYTQNCMLMKMEHYTQFFTSGVGHKVQCLYCRGGLPTTLPLLPFLVDYTDWFKKALNSFGTECIYIQEALAATCGTKYDNKIRDLIIRLYLVKRLELTRGISFSHKQYEYLDKLTSEQIIYRNLALLALQYGAEALAEADYAVVKEILLFAEMVFEPITLDKAYSALKESLASGRPLDNAEQFRIREESVPPPEGAMLIPELAALAFLTEMQYPTAAL